MSNRVRQAFQAAAGAAGGDPVTVDQVFSIDLWAGTGNYSLPRAEQTITNGIDLSGEGGMVWIKARNSGTRHGIFSTPELGVNNFLYANETYAKNSNQSTTYSNTGPNQYNSDGFKLGDERDGFGLANQSGNNYVGWTFRKAPKFFTIHTFTHSNPTASSYDFSNDGLTSLGMVIIKRLDAAGQWRVWHRSATSGHLLKLNSTNASASDVTFSVSGTTATMVGGEPSGQYIWYAWADNSSEDAADQMISCGSYSASASGVEINLGWEPQWVMVKRTDSAYSWYILDTMRGFNASDTPATLKPNSYDAEGGLAKYRITSTGFKWNSDSGDSGTYIYMAIRAPMMAEPTDATEVFHVLEQAANVTEGTNITTGFPVDFQLLNRLAGQTLNTRVFSRLQGFSSTDTASGRYLSTSRTSQEVSGANTRDWDNTGFDIPDANNEINASIYSWKRAKSYFDVVCYNGTGSVQTVPHSLGAGSPPEMMWVKARTQSNSWATQHKAYGANQSIDLDSTAGLSGGKWNNTRPTDVSFTLGTDWETNRSGYPYVAYLFATLAGVSKVSSVVHSGTTNVDAGFTNGSRFVLLKLMSSGSGWYVWDSVRGIVSGNDPYLLLNSNAAEVTNTDYIDPYSAGFTITSSFPAGTYIYYAIA